MTVEQKDRITALRSSGKAMLKSPVRGKVILPPGGADGFLDAGFRVEATD